VDCEYEVLASRPPDNEDIAFVVKANLVSQLLARSSNSF
jgi:hypothetical protein